MKNILALICVMTFSVSAFSLELASIEVNGKASVMAKPDKFSLTISIRERGKSSTKTKQVVDAKSQQIVKLFLNEGVKKSAIDSSQVRMFPIYEKPSITVDSSEFRTNLSEQEQVHLDLNSHKKNKKKLIFEVARTITVNFNQLTFYDKVLDQVIKVGVSHISPMEMSFQDPKKLYQQALMQAISDAKEKAERIAQHSNVKLGQLYSVRETGYHAPMRFAMAQSESFRGETLVTDKQISAQVIAVYLIEQ